MNSRNITTAERNHLARIKALPCAVCKSPGPSEAHHPEQGSHYVCIALCVECHRGPVLGWHGQKRAWAVRKMSELDALNETLRALMAGEFA